MTDLKAGITSAQNRNRPFQLLWKGTDVVLLVGMIGKDDIKKAETALPPVGKTNIAKGLCSYDAEKNHIVLWSPEIPLTSTFETKLQKFIKDKGKTPVKEVTLTRKKKDLLYTDEDEGAPPATGLVPTAGAEPSRDTTPTPERKPAGSETTPPAAQEAALFNERVKSLLPFYERTIALTPETQVKLKKMLDEAKGIARPGSYPAALSALDKWEAAIQQFRDFGKKRVENQRVEGNLKHIFDIPETMRRDVTEVQGQHLDKMLKTITKRREEIEAQIKFGEAGARDECYRSLCESIEAYEKTFAAYQKAQRYSPARAGSAARLKALQDKIAETGATEAQRDELKRSCDEIQFQLKGTGVLQVDFDAAAHLKQLEERFDEIESVNRDAASLREEVEKIDVVDGLNETQRAEFEGDIASIREEIDAGINVRGRITNLQERVSTCRDVNGRREEFLEQLDAVSVPGEGITDPQREGLEAKRAEIRGQIEAGYDPTRSLEALPNTIAETLRVNTEREKYLSELHRLGAMKVVDHPSEKLVLLPDSEMFGESFKSISLLLDSGSDPTTTIAALQQLVAEFQAAQVESEACYRMLDGVPIPKGASSLQMIEHLQERETIRGDIGRGADKHLHIWQIKELARSVIAIEAEAKLLSAGFRLTDEDLTDSWTREKVPARRGVVGNDGDRVSSFKTLVAHFPDQKDAVDRLLANG